VQSQIERVRYDLKMKTLEKENIEAEKKRVAEEK